MFKKVEEIRKTRQSQRLNSSFGQIYQGGQKPSFSLNIHEQPMKDAKLCIGDIAKVYLAEDNNKAPWLVIEAAHSNGHMLVAASASSPEARRAKRGTHDAAVIKTTRIDNFLGRYFTERMDWESRDIETRVGSIAFPLERKKVWFKR